VLMVLARSLFYLELGWCCVFVHWRGAGAGVSAIHTGVGGNICPAVH